MIRTSVATVGLACTQGGASRGGPVPRTSLPHRWRARRRSGVVSGPPDMLPRLTLTSGDSARRRLTGARVLFLVALPAMSVIPASAQGNWDRYVPGRIGAVVEQHDAAIRDSYTSTPIWLISAESYPTRATVEYTGESRPITDTRLDSSAVGRALSANRNRSQRFSSGSTCFARTVLSTGCRFRHPWPPISRMNSCLGSR